MNLLILSCILLLASSQVIKNDCGLSLIRQSSSILDAQLITRGRDGYSVFAVSKNDTNFKDAFVCMYFLEDRKTIFNIYRGSENSTQITPHFNTRTLPYFNRTVSKSDFPFGRYYHDVMQNVLFNSQEFLKEFGTDFYLFIGFSEEYPESPLVFNPTLKESFMIRVNFTRPMERLNILSMNRRLEYFHLAPYFLVLIFYFIIFILLICFCKHQPLKSRGIDVYISCVCLFIDILSGFPQFTFTLEQFKANCIVIELIQRPARGVVLFFSLFGFIRYVILIAIQKRKENVVKELKNNPKKKCRVDWKFKILKHSGKWYSSLLYATIVWCASAFIYLQVYFYRRFKCTPELTNDINYKVWVVFWTLIGIAYVIVFIIDILLNREIIRDCNFAKLYHDDVFYYRFQIYIFGISAFVYVTVWQYINLVSFDSNTTVLVGILNSFVYYSLFFYQILFVLLVTIFTAIVNCGKNKADDSYLLELLADKEIHDLFIEFCRNEFSIENVLCYDEIQIYKETTDNVKKLGLGYYIHNKYLNSDSDLEVNLPTYISKEILEKLQTGIAPKNLFDLAEREIFVNLSDTFSRINLTPEFQKLIKTRKFFKEALNK